MIWPDEIRTSRHVLRDYPAIVAVNALAERKCLYEAQGRTVAYREQSAKLKVERKTNPYLTLCNFSSCQRTLKRLDRAFQAFFRRAQAGETAGCPRFQGRTRYHSFTYPQIGEHGCARLDNGFLVLSKIGRVTVRWSRPTGGHT